MTIQDTQKIKIFRKLRGIVVSDKMDKTVVVKVDRTRVHPKYKKRYVISKRYKVHDPENKCCEGDYVEFIASRPISKDKKWKLSEIIKAAPKVEKLPEVESEVKHKEREELKKQELLAKKEFEATKETIAEEIEDKK
ncbi:MAG: 30S ribosomal protein S17 [Patescibacteria group bacterium]